MEQKINEMAKKYGFDGVRYIGMWKSQKVYDPLFADAGTHFIGYPQYILSKGGKARWTRDFKESMEIFDALH